MSIEMVEAVGQWILIPICITSILMWLIHCIAKDF
jgi:hypothetical protein